MADTVARARILLAEANQLHGRLLDTILAVQSRALTFLGLVLTFIGVQVSSVAILTSLGTTLRVVHWTALGVSAAVASAAAAFALAVVRPGEFRDKEIFDEAILNTLGEEDLLRQLIADTQHWYEHNFDQLDPRLRSMPRAYWTFVASVVAYFMFLVVLILG